MKFLIFMLLSCATLSGGIMSQLNSNGDHGIWFDQYATIDLPHHWKLRFNSEERLGANYKKAWNYSLEGVFLYAFDSHLNAGGGYEANLGLQRNTNNNYNWVWSHIPILEVNLTLKYCKWTVFQRFRAEYNFYMQKDYVNYGVYRQILQIQAPWKYTRLEWSPFISNEAFFQKSGGFHENRLWIGMGTGFSDRVSTSLCYQWRAVKQPAGTHPGWFNTYHYVFNFNIEY